jgi:hypothetical protein
MVLNRSKLYILFDQIRDSGLYCAGKRELVYTALKLVARKPRIPGRDFVKSGCGFLEESFPVLKAEKMIADIL